MMTLHLLVFHSDPVDALFCRDFPLWRRAFNPWTRIKISTQLFSKGFFTPKLRSLINSFTFSTPIWPQAIGTTNWFQTVTRLRLCWGVWNVDRYRWKRCLILWMKHYYRLIVNNQTWLSAMVIIIFHIQKCLWISEIDSSLKTKDSTRAVICLISNTIKFWKKNLDTKFDQNEKSGFLVKDLVRLELGADLITYGDFKMHKGNEVPTDTYLTPKLEFCSK